MKPISDEARHLLLDAVTREVRQLEEMYERAPIGSAYRVELRARMSALTDRYYEVQRAPRLQDWRCICGSGDDGEWHSLMCVATNTPDEEWYDQPAT